MARPKMITEQVQGGLVLVDCAECGTLGVWPDRLVAKRVKNEHVCGKPDTVPGKVGTRVVFGPRPGGM